MSVISRRDDTGGSPPAGFGHKPLKDRIFYHRAYRIIPRRSRWYFLLAFLLLGVVPNIILYFAFPDITLAISQTARRVLSTSLSEEFIHVISRPFMGQTVHFLETPGRYPLLNFSIAIALLSLAVMIVVPYLKRITKPVGVWILLFAFMNLVSSLFFVFVPDRFPYGVETFSDLYIKTEVSMWFVIPVILALALIAFPSSIWGKLVLIVGALAYDIAFSVLRYIVFLYLLQKATFVFMAIMFFLFGPLVDFLYIVGFYSYYVYRIARVNREDFATWKWSY